MADNVFLGGVVDESQITDITPTGTHSTADVISLSTYGQVLQVEVGTDTANTDIANLIQTALASSSLTTDGLVYGSRTKFSEIGPMGPDSPAGISQPVAGTVRIVGRPGFPFTITPTSSGDPTATFTTTVQNSATGRSFGDNAANWSGGLPDGTHTLVLKDTSVPILWGLSALAPSPVWEIWNSYTGQIGVPDEYAPAGGASFVPETTHVVLSADVLLKCGIGAGRGPSLVRIDCGDTYDLLTGSFISGSGKVEVKNLAAAVVDLLSGESHLGGVATTVVVHGGKLYSSLSAGAITVHDGTVVGSDGLGASLAQYGGNVDVLQGGLATAELYGKARLKWSSSGALGASLLRLTGESHLDMSGAKTGFTIGNVEVAGKPSWVPPPGGWPATSTFDLNDVIDESGLPFGPRSTVTISANVGADT